MTEAGLSRQNSIKPNKIHIYIKKSKQWVHKLPELQRHKSTQDKQARDWSSKQSCVAGLRHRWSDEGQREDYNHIYTESNECRVETLGEQNTAEPDQKMKHGEVTLKTRDDNWKYNMKWNDRDLTQRHIFGKIREICWDTHSWEDCGILFTHTWMPQTTSFYTGAHRYDPNVLS